ncbi:MAG: FtsQ-type POTRA domain-containing protein [Patescibacteria group bacterium]
MKKKSASTLIYFQEKARKKSLVKRPHHINKEKRTKHVLTVFKLLGFFTLAGFLIWYYVKYRPLNIRSVEISGAERFVNKEDIKKIAEEKSLGKNIVLLNTKNLREVIASNFLASRSVKVGRQFPSRLKIIVTERVPIALILPKDSKEFYFVDADGFILGPADKSATNLPVINYSQGVEVGKFVEANAVKYYFDLIKALDDDNVAVSTISTYPRYTEFFTVAGFAGKEETQVLFTNDQNPKPQAKIFSKMMEAFKTEGKKLKKIDLRFDKVIVEFIN